MTKFVEIGLGFGAERRMGDVDLVSQAVRLEVEAVILVPYVVDFGVIL